MDGWYTQGDTTWHYLVKLRTGAKMSEGKTVQIPIGGRFKYGRVPGLFSRKCEKVRTSPKANLRAHVHEKNPLSTLTGRSEE